MINNVHHYWLDLLFFVCVLDSCSSLCSLDYFPVSVEMDETDKKKYNEEHALLLVGL